MLSAISVLFSLLCMQIDINKFVSGIQSMSLIPTILRLIHSILYTRLSISVDSGNLWVCPSMTLKCPFPSGNPDPPLNAWFLGLHEFTSQTACRSVQPFQHSSRS